MFLQGTQEEEEEEGRGNNLVFARRNCLKCLKLGGLPVGVWRVSGRCRLGVCRMSGWCLEGIYGMFILYVGCLDGFELGYIKSRQLRSDKSS